MEITVRRDGATVDITGAVAVLYEVVCECVRWDRDLNASDAEAIAVIASACGYPLAEYAAKVAAGLREEENEERMRRRDAQRSQAAAVVAVLDACG